ncbi:MAG: hypothetical protein WBO23_02650, partial [Burkholderiales bacterium]
MATTTPPPLSAKHNRDATPPLRGFDYQVWAAIDAWCCLKPNEAIYFEGAEDFDRVSEEDALAIQVRLRQAKVSLGARACLEAIEHFWDLVGQDESTRTLRYSYLTTSEVAVEADADFGGIPGIEMWRIAASDPAASEQLRTYLLRKLAVGTSFHSFLTSAPVNDLQQRLFRRFEWLPGQPRTDAVQESVLERLANHAEASGLAAPELRKLRNNLLAFAWEQFTKPELSDRILTAELLSEQIRVATTITLSVRIQQLPSLIAASAAQGLSAVAPLFAAEIPPVPMPLLDRAALVDTVRRSLKQGRHTLLVGGVHRGKTTIAQLAASAHDANAWWITLRGRDPTSVEAVLRAVSMLVAGMGHRVIVLDDLDLEPEAFKKYDLALRLLLHRATRAAKTVLATAQASAPQTAIFDSWTPRFEVAEIPELSETDIAGCCVAFGCTPGPWADFWGRFVYMQTLGHPRLVHVRLQELQQRAWPQVEVNDLVMPSPAMAAAKQLARQLYAKSSDEAERTFMYTASVATIPLTREMLIGIAASAEVTHPGDVIDRLVGRWIETVPPNRYRVTPMLMSAAGDAWGAAGLQPAHKRIARGIGTTTVLTPADGAAMLFHGFLGNDAQVVQGAIEAIQLGDDPGIRAAIYPHLHWMMYLQPSAGAPLFRAHPGVSLLLRYLQFDVALQEHSDKLGSILQGWKDEVERTTDEALRRENLAFLYLRALGVLDGQLSIHMVFDAVQYLSTANGEIVAVAKSQLKKATLDAELEEAAGDATGVRTWLALKANVIRSLDDFRNLVGWLRDKANDELRMVFDEVIGWPIVQATGAFVHGAWAKEEADSSWIAWVEALDNAREYARDFRSPKFAAEIAKAKSIILVEYLNDPDGGLRAIEDAEKDFGPSSILQEQRANVFFHRNDDKAVLEIFARLDPSESAASLLSDPFAYRRVAISAARLGRWKESADFYFRGVETVRRNEFSLTRIGLLGDAAFALSKAGNEIEALKVLGDAVEQLVRLCPEKIDRQWVALRAALAAVAMAILNGGPNKVTPGLVSSPNKPSLPENADHLLATQLIATMCAEADARAGRETAAHVEAVINSSTHPLIRSLYAKANVFRAISRTESSDLFLSLANKWADAFFALAAAQAPMQRLTEEGRWGFLVAAVILAGENAGSQLEKWISDAGTEQRADQVAALEKLREGLTLPQGDVRATAYDSSAHVLRRAGACFRLLQADQRTEVDTAGAQALLLSVMGNGLAVSLYPGIARRIIEWLARSWQPLIEHGFLFNR